MQMEEKKCSDCKFWISSGWETCSVTKAYIGFCKERGYSVVEDAVCEKLVSKLTELPNKT